MERGEESLAKRGVGESEKRTIDGDGLKILILFL